MLREVAVANVKTWKFVVGGPFNTIVSFEYKLGDVPGVPDFQSCAARVMFDSFKQITVFEGSAPVIETYKSHKK